MPNPCQVRGWRRPSANPRVSLGFSGFGRAAARQSLPGGVVPAAAKSARRGGHLKWLVNRRLGWCRQRERGPQRMRVEGNRPIRPTTARRDDKAVGSSGAFAEALGVGADDGRDDGLAHRQPRRAVRAAGGRRSRWRSAARRWPGRHRSSTVSTICSSAFSRARSTGRASPISPSTARAARDQTDDANLQQILDEIELRAAVELAKLGSPV